MKYAILMVAGATLAFASGCCNKHVDARLVLGHQTLDVCARLVKEGVDAPVSITCPGDEVTLCWGTPDNNGVHIEVEHDPGGITGDYSGHTGVVYFTPTETTKVTVTADCVSKQKKVQVVTGDTPVGFDGLWSGDCKQVSYEADPLFYSQSLQAKDVQPQWAPMQGGMPLQCKAEPFLSAFHDTDLYNFSIAKVFDLYKFEDYLHNPTPHPLYGNWQYDPKACVGDGFKCDHNAHEPFQMTVACKGQ